jgi:TrmH family RNA methyltransferase
VVITSARNPRVKALAGLRRRRERERSQRMLVEGFDELAMALDSGGRPLALYYCPALVRDSGQLPVLDRAREIGAEILELSREVFEKVAYRESPDGWLAEFPAIPTDLERLHLGASPLVLVCAGVEKPGNLGAMLRTAEAAGVDAVITSPAVTDWGNPNIVRASRGAIFAVPVAEAEPEELIGWLRVRGLTVVVAAPEAETPYSAAGLSGGVAIVVGAESHGLGEEWARSADLRVRIPMFGRVNSLNVAASAALLVYEALRQRGQLVS